MANVRYLLDVALLCMFSIWRLGYMANLGMVSRGMRTVHCTVANERGLLR